MNNDEVKVHEKNINAPVTRKRILILGKEGTIEGMLVESLRRLGHDVILDTVNNVTWYEHQIKEADAVFSDPTLAGHVTVQQICFENNKPLLKIRGINDIVNGMIKELDKLNLNEGFSKTGEKLTPTPASQVFPSKDKKIEKAIDEAMREEGVKPLFDAPVNESDTLNNESDTASTGL